MFFGVLAACLINLFVSKLVITWLLHKQEKIEWEYEQKMQKEYMNLAKLIGNPIESNLSSPKILS